MSSGANRDRQNRFRIDLGHAIVSQKPVESCAKAAGVLLGLDALSLPRLDMLSFLSEFWMFLWVRKKFWLLPIFIMMLLFGSLLVLSKGSAVAPFIYAIF